MEDSRLLRLLRKDPNAGMERLMDQYAGLVWAVVKSRLDPSFALSFDAEDCVADVFSSFYAELSRFDPTKASIKTYLCIMARNRAINLSKKRCREGRIPSDEARLLLQPSDDIEIDSELSEAELRREVIEAVTALGQPDSSILFRKLYYGESSKEIAAALGMTVSNVDTRTHRALNKLRSRLGGRKA